MEDRNYPIATVNAGSNSRGEARAVSPGPPQVPDESRWDRLRRYMEIANKAGEIIMSLRDKPTLKDFIALGMRSVSLVDSVRAEISNATRKPPIYFFTKSPESWRMIGGLRGAWVCEYAEERRPGPGRWDGLSDRLVLAHLGGVKVGWIGRGKDHLTWPCRNEVFIEDPSESGEGFKKVMAAIGSNLWSKLGSKHMAFRDRAMVQDELGLESYIVPSSFQGLRDRLTRFIEAGRPRAVLLNGQPGTGKSMGARYLAAQLGVSSLRVGPEDVALGDRPVAAHDPNYESGQYTPLPSLDDLLETLRPDTVIIDDLDRLPHDSTHIVLSLVERLRKSCKIILISVNCPERMVGAVLRPGRGADDIIEVGPPEKAVIEKIFGDELYYDEKFKAPRRLYELVYEELSDVPITYVFDFADRVAALGPAEAVKEIEKVKKHAEMVARMTERENQFHPGYPR